MDLHGTLWHRQGKLTLTVLSMPLTAINGKVGCCSITKFADRQLSHNPRLLEKMIYHSQLTHHPPKFHQADPFLCPKRRSIHHQNPTQSCLILFPKSYLINPHISISSIPSLFIVMTIAKKREHTILDSLHVSRALEYPSWVNDFDVIIGFARCRTRVSAKGKTKYW